jgi:Tfp pilus assembly protein PilF
MTIAASEPTSLRLAAEALTYSAKIDVDLAREALSRSLKLDPDPRTMVKIAQIHLANGEYGQAAECYMRAAEMREAGHLDIGLNPMTLRNLGQRANGLAKVQDMYDQSIER